MPLLTRLAIADSADPVSARVAEIVGVGAAGSGVLVAKVCATALVTGAVVGGVAVVPDNGRDERRGMPAGTEPARAAETSAAGTAESGDRVPFPSGGDSDRAETRREGEDDGRRSDGDADGDERAALSGEARSGRGDTDDHRGDGERSGRDGDGSGDRSGPDGGREVEQIDDHSGPGSGEGDREPEVQEAFLEDNSGPGGGEPDSDEPLDLPEPEEPDNSGPG